MQCKCVCVFVFQMKPSHQPPALLTAFRTLTALCAIGHMLFANAVLISFTVTSRARTDTSLKTPSTQNLTAVQTDYKVNSYFNMFFFPANEIYFIQNSLYSLVSKVTMMRIGRLFIPPTQLELHMKLYKMVVNSVPTCQ